MSFGQYSQQEKPATPTLPASTKREKHVFGSNDTGVQHVWASPLTKDGSGYAQTWGTNPGKNFYFKTDTDGTRTLYSYRDSYPVASTFAIGKNKRSTKRVYLIRSGKPYSVTTATHMNAAYGAVPLSAIRFSVPFVTRNENLGNGSPDKQTHIANLADYIVRINSAIQTQTRARSTYVMDQSHTDAISLRNQAKQYARTFGLKLPKLPAVPAIDKAKYDKWKAYEDGKAERTKALRERQAIEREQKYAELLTQWKQGENVSLPYGIGNYALLRVRKHGDSQMANGEYVVETSQHVTVPIAGKLGAARLLRFLQSLKAQNKTYQRNGHTEHIGNFTVESFKPAVATATPDDASAMEWILVAGCHRIRYSEIESIAQQVFDADIADTLAGKTTIADYLDGQE